jgi:hypothetical protein
MSGSFFRGTTADQDSRFGNAEKKLYAKLTFDPIVNAKVRRRSVLARVVGCS